MNLDSPIRHMLENWSSNKIVWDLDSPSYDFNYNKLKMIVFVEFQTFLITPSFVQITLYNSIEKYNLTTYEWCIITPYFAHIDFGAIFGIVSLLCFVLNNLIKNAILLNDIFEVLILRLLKKTEKTNEYKLKNSKKRALQSHFYITFVSG